jgi:hypothetical protein
MIKEKIDRDTEQNIQVKSTTHPKPPAPASSSHPADSRSSTAAAQKTLSSSHTAATPALSKTKSTTSFPRQHHISEACSYTLESTY